MKVRIPETLAKIVDISAEAEEETIEKIKKLYKTSEITLSSDDFCRVEFDVLQPQCNAEKVDTTHCKWQKVKSPFHAPHTPHESGEKPHNPHHCTTRSKVETV